MRDEARDELEQTHRQYRRDLVPLRQAPVFGRTGVRRRAPDGKRGNAMALDPNRWTLKTQEAMRCGCRARPCPEQRRGDPRPPPRRPARAARRDGRAAAGQGGGRAHRPHATGWRTGSLPCPRSTAAPRSACRASARDLLEAADTLRADMGDEYLSVEHLLLALSDLVGVEPRRAARRPCARCAAATGSRRRTPRSSTRPSRVRPRPHRARPPGQARPGHRARRGDPPRHPGAVAAAPRTTPCSSASPAWARPPSWRASPSASSRATSPRACATSASWPSTCPRWSPGPSTAASSRSA